MGPQGTPQTRRILFTLASLAAILFLSIAGNRPPRAKPVNAPPAEFSGGRARQELSMLLGSGIPHPTGSAANDAVRDRITDELTKLGYSPEVQAGFACDEYGACADVNNIVARLDGTDVTSSKAPATGGAQAQDPAVLLAAHYDSVAAGPGASDDGAGVAAVLEIARALKSQRPPRHSIIFLIDDGEEGGLLGARVFVDQHPWAAEVRAAVNIDARGSSGPSLMFETGSANEWAIQLYARSVHHPATSSIFYTAYKQLPNDTDFTVFKAAGYQGLNFANIGDVAHYHTPLDNLENADPGTLQHHGDNALPVVLALANSDLAHPQQREAVFFDVFESGMIWWRASWTRAMALGATILLIFQIVWLFRVKRLEPNAFVWGLFGWLEIVVVTGVLALILHWLIRWAGALPVSWVAHPLPLQIAFWSLGFSVVVIVTLASARRAGFWGLWTGVWMWWAILSVLIAWNEPGMSYLILVPTVAAALVGLPFTLRRNESPGGAGFAVILPLLIAAILAFSPALLLYSGLGNGAMAGIAVLLAIILSPIAPLLADGDEAPGILRIALPGVPVALTLLAAFSAIVVPVFSAKAPERANILYWLDGDAGKAEWIVNPASGNLPEALQVAANFRRVDAAPFPWSKGVSYLADAPKLADAAPTFTVEQTLRDAQHDRTSYRALLRSERGAPEAMVLFPPDAGVDSVRVEDVPVEPETKRVRAYMNGWTAYDCLTMNPKGIEISFTLPDGKPVAVYAVDESYGLPAEGMFLLKARPLTATQSDEGDRTVVSRRVELLP